MRADVVGEEEKYANGETFQLIMITQLLQRDLEWAQTLLGTHEDVEALLGFLSGQGRAPHSEQDLHWENP